MDSMIIHSDYSVDNSPNFLQNLEQKSKATASEYTEESKDSVHSSDIDLPLHQSPLAHRKNNNSSSSEYSAESREV